MRKRLSRVFSAFWEAAQDDAPRWRHTGGPKRQPPAVPVRSATAIAWAARSGELHDACVTATAGCDRMHVLGTQLPVRRSKIVCRHAYRMAWRKELEQRHGALVILLALVLGLVCAYAHRMCRRHHIIYMDHNGTTPYDREALNTYIRVAREVFGNPSTMCVAGNAAKDCLERARMDIAAELGARQTEVIFTSGATESNVIILRGFAARAKHLGRKCTVLTTPIEHASVDRTVADLPGVTVQRVQVDRHGLVNIAHVFSLLGQVQPGSHVLIAVIWVNNEVGTIQDAVSLARICRTGAPQDCHVHVHLDATQVVGRFLIDFATLDIDSASFSAHKFCGGHSCGGLYLRRQCELASPITGGKQEKGIRGGTEDVAGAASMATALQVANRRLRGGWTEHIRSMRDYMLQALSAAVPDIVVNNHPLRCAYNTISICLPCDSRELVAHLSSKHRMCLGVGSACSKAGGSKTLQALGLAKEHIDGSLRISLGVGNQMWQCKRVVSAIVAYLGEHKRCSSVDTVTA